MGSPLFTGANPLTLMRQQQSNNTPALPQLGKVYVKIKGTNSSYEINLDAIRYFEREPAKKTELLKYFNFVETTTIEGEKVLCAFLDKDQVKLTKVYRGSNSVMCCGYNSTNDYLQANLGKKLDSSDREWYCNSPFTIASGIPFNHTLYVINELVAGYELGISAVYWNKNMIPSDPTLIQAWQSALNYSPLQSTDDTLQVIEEFEGTNSEDFFREQLNNSGFHYFDPEAKLSGNKIRRIKQFIRGSDRPVNSSATVFNSGNGVNTFSPNGGHFSFVGSKFMGQSPLIALEFDHIDNILRRNPNYLTALKGHNYHDQITKQGLPTELEDVYDLVLEDCTVEGKSFFHYWNNRSSASSTPNRSYYSGNVYLHGAQNKEAEELFNESAEIHSSVYRTPQSLPTMGSVLDPNLPTSIEMIQLKSPKEFVTDCFTQFNLNELYYLSALYNPITKDFNFRALFPDIANDDNTEFVIKQVEIYRELMKANKWENLKDKAKGLTLEIDVFAMAVAIEASRPERHKVKEILQEYCKSAAKIWKAFDFVVDSPVYVKKNFEGLREASEKFDTLVTLSAGFTYLFPGEIYQFNNLQGKSFSNLTDAEVGTIVRALTDYFKNQPSGQPFDTTKEKELVSDFVMGGQSQVFDLLQYKINISDLADIARSVIENPEILVSFLEERVAHIFYNYISSFTTTTK